MTGENVKSEVSVKNIKTWVQVQELGKGWRWRSIGRWNEIFF